MGQKKTKKAKYKPNEKIQLPDGANPINFDGPRDFNCRHNHACMKYLLQKDQYCRFFSCVYCEKASKEIKAGKPANTEIMDFVNQKPAVKKFSLPNGANPVHVRGLVDMFCGSYKNCRKYIRRVHKDWLYFSCIKCPKSSIKAQGSNFDTNVKYIA